MLSRFIKQLSILIIVSIFFGLTLKQFHISLFYSIPFGILIQFGIYYAFITVLNAYVELKNKKLENERIREFSFQGLEVTCPCVQQKTEFVPIVLNTNNAYKCNYCQKNISVYIVPETALVTETVALPIIPTTIPVIDSNYGNT